MTQREENKEDK